MYRLNYNFFLRAKLQTFDQSLLQRIWIELKSITYKWNWFQKSFTWASIGDLSFPFLYSKFWRQGCYLFHTFQKEEKLFVNFDSQKQLFTATPITLLWNVTTNSTANLSTNYSNLFEFFWLCSELLVAVTTALNKVFHSRTRV